MKFSNVPPCPGNQERIARTNINSIAIEQKAETHDAAKEINVCINKPPISNYCKKGCRKQSPPLFCGLSARKTQRDDFAPLNLLSIGC
jgi:hypothetical protein